MRWLGAALLVAGCAPRTPALSVDALDARVRAFAATHRQAPLRQHVPNGDTLQLRCVTGRRCDATSFRLRWGLDAEGVRLSVVGPGALLRGRRDLALQHADLAVPLSLGTPGWTLAASGRALEARLRWRKAGKITVEIRGTLTRVVASRATDACRTAADTTAACERRYTTRLPVVFVWTGVLDREPLDCREWPASGACE